MPRKKFDRPRHVIVFAPYVEKNGVLESPHYDLPAYREEIAGWMAALGATWEWVPVTTASLAGDIAAAAAKTRGSQALVFNLCDGTAVDGYPGIEVVDALEAHAIPYTGSDPAFYRVTTAKSVSKARFKSHGVPTAPAVLLHDVERDLDRAVSHVGFPIMVKPDVSAGSYGIQVDSVVHDIAAARRRIGALKEGLHGQHFELGGVLLERFVQGREFTVLAVEDANAPLGLWVLPPCERVFDRRVPKHERFLAYERYWSLPEASRPIPIGDPYYWYDLAPIEFRAELEDIARRAVRSVGGAGYARVDIRYDETDGRFYVLEVNAQCGLSSDDSSTVGSMLRLSGVSMVDIVARILDHGATRRKHIEGTQAMASAKLLGSRR